jgi:hypothetical protein
VAARNSQAVEASRRPGSSRLGSEPGPPVAPSTPAERRRPRLTNPSIGRAQAPWEAPQLLRLGYFGMALASYGLLRDGTYQRLQN